MLVTEINPNDELWLSEVESPQIITDPNLFDWDDEADLVIAGLGGAGIAAANEALDQNLTVIGIDKTSGGGSTAKSGGVFLCRWRNTNSTCCRRSGHSRKYV